MHDDRVRDDRVRDDRVRDDRVRDDRVCDDRCVTIASSTDLQTRSRKGLCVLSASVSR